MKKHLHKIIISNSTILVIILISSPSFALSLSIPNFISSVFNEIKGEYSKLNQQVQNSINDSWAEIATDAREAIESAIGEMGTPDPKTSAHKLREKLRNSRSLPEIKTLSQRLERDLTYASTTTTLGLEGQLDTKKKIEATTQISTEAQSLAQQAQTLDASQNILKIIAAQNAQVVSAITRFHADSLATRQDTAQSNLMLSQVAENLANSTTKEELKTTGQASLTQELVFMSVLDPARN